MKNLLVWVILSFFLSGCTSSKTNRTPLQECLITEGPDDLIAMRINRYVKEELNYTKNIVAVVSASNGTRSENHLTSKGRVVGCKSILKFDDGSSETGMITNESWKTPTYALSYTPNIAIVTKSTSNSSMRTSPKGICIGNIYNCSGTSSDEYYESNPTTPEDVRRNEEYMRNHQAYVCRTVSPSYADGVKVREYIVFDPRECR